MFTIPAIHHSATRLEDGSMATLHLNALNGSSNVLSSSGSHSNNSFVFGGLFGVSVSENHPYRPEDTGSTFHQTSKATNKSLSQSWSNSSTMSAPSTSLEEGNSLPKSPHTKMRSNVRTNVQTKALADLDTMSLRRLSLDLDITSDNSCCHLDDRSLSLENLKRVSNPNPNPRCIAEIVNENDFSGELSLTGLSITEVNITTSDAEVTPRGETSQSSRTNKQANRHKRRALTTDATTSGRALRLLEKIKDSKREQAGSSYKPGKQEDQVAQPHTQERRVSSKGSRHITRHLSDSATQSVQRENGKQKQRKALTRSSMD